MVADSMEIMLKLDYKSWDNCIPFLNDYKPPPVKYLTVNRI